MPILLETGSVNTAGNCAAIAAAARRHGWSRLAVVTSEYHLARVRELLRLPGGGQPPPAPMAGSSPARAGGHPGR